MVVQLQLHISKDIGSLSYVVLFSPLFAVIQVEFLYHYSYFPLCALRISGFSYLIGCDNILAKLHTRNPEACDKVGGVIIMHIDDLRRFALYWLLKTQEVRADTEHYATNITGDIYQSGWISEMYGYSFGAAEVLSIQYSA